MYRGSNNYRLLGIGQLHIADPSAVDVPAEIMETGEEGHAETLIAIRRAVRMGYGYTAAVALIKKRLMPVVTDGPASMCLEFLDTTRFFACEAPLTP